MEIRIPGDPIAKKRPRFARRGKFTVTYNCQETEEGQALLLCRGQITGILSGPLSVEMVFYVRRPASHFGTGKNKGVLKFSSPAFPERKPDIDNFQKFYFDILNGLAWNDDSQVCRVVAEKKYADLSQHIMPSTVIIIKRLWE